MSELDSPIIKGWGQVKLLGLPFDEGKLWDYDGHLSLKADFDGLRSNVDGDESIDRHFGPDRMARIDQIGEWRHRPVMNDRQVSVALVSDLEKIAKELEIDLDPAIGPGGDPDYADLSQEDQLIHDLAASLGANIVIETNSTERIVPGSRLFIGQVGVGAIVRINEAHLPCSRPTTLLARYSKLPHAVLKERFKGDKSKLKPHRGYMGQVYQEGVIAVGDAVAVQQPVDFTRQKPSGSKLK